MGDVRPETLVYLRDKVFEVGYDTLMHRMPFLRSVVEVYPWSYCVVMLSFGLGEYSDPVICECDPWYRTAIETVDWYLFDIDKCDPLELMRQYPGYGFPGYQYEIWYVVPYEPFGFGYGHG